MSTCTTSIDIDDIPIAFELDFATARWTAEPRLHESYFPLVAVVDGKRYELYSDGHFAEEELR